MFGAPNAGCSDGTVLLVAASREIFQLSWEETALLGTIFLTALRIFRFFGHVDDSKILPVTRSHPVLLGFKLATSCQAFLWRFVACFGLPSNVETGEPWGDTCLQASSWIAMVESPNESSDRGPIAKPTTMVMAVFTSIIAAYPFYGIITKLSKPDLDLCPMQRPAMQLSTALHRLRRAGHSP